MALARPRQWVKNALVVGAPGAAGALGYDDVPARVLVTCAAFCLLSAGIYALNDVRDRDEDRCHPRKWRRPVAAGDVAPGAVAHGLAWIVCGLVLAVAVAPAVALVGLGYIALTVSYSWVWRHIALLDLVALGGLSCVPPPGASPRRSGCRAGLSSWSRALLCSWPRASAWPRWRVRARGGHARRVLRTYTQEGLRWVLALAGMGALFAYCVWAFEVPDIDGVPWRPLTVIPFAVCLVRYGTLVQAGVGERRRRSSPPTGPSRLPAAPGCSCSS